MIVVVAAVDREWKQWRASVGLAAPPPAGSLHRVREDLGLLRLGVGPSAADRALSALPSEGIRALLHIGFVGGLRAGMGSGTLVVATSVGDRVLQVGGASASGPESSSSVRPIHLDEGGVDALRSRLALLPERLAQGGLLTVDRFVNRADDKRALAAKNWLVCEMEASVVAAKARALGIDYFGVRAVSDADDEDLPPLSRDGGKVRTLGRALRWAARPSAPGDTFRMLRGLRRAERALEVAIPAALDALYGMDAEHGAPDSSDDQQAG